MKDVVSVFTHRLSLEVSNVCWKKVFGTRVMILFNLLRSPAQSRKSAVLALNSWRLSERMFGSFKMPETSSCRQKRTLEDTGFFALTYAADRAGCLDSFLRSQGAEHYGILLAMDNNIDPGIKHFAINGEPALELAILNQDEVDVCAVSTKGETLIMGMAFHHRDFIAIKRDIVEEPLPFLK